MIFLHFNSMRTYLFLLLVLCPCSLIIGQDTLLKTLDHRDFLIWKTLQDPQLSPDGSFTTYRLIPGEGDPSLHIYSSGDSSTYIIPRVNRSGLSYDGKFIFGLITPHRDTLRMLERKKTEKKDMPPDTLFIYNTITRTTTLIPSVTGYKSPEKLGDWLAYTIKKSAFDPDTIKKSKESKKEIVHLIVRQLSSGIQDTLHYVNEYVWAAKEPLLVAIVETKDSLYTPGVYYFRGSTWKSLKKEKGEYTMPAISPDGHGISFLGNLDTTKAQVPPWQLFYFNFKSDSAYSVAHQNNSHLPLVSQHLAPEWSDDNRYLFYGRAEMPLVRDTTLLEDESVNVEIWSTTDPVLYTMQNVNKPNDEKRSYRYVYDTQSGKHIEIGSPAWDSSVLTREKNARYALVYNDRPYQKEVAWLGEAAKDLAIIDLHTGKVTPFKKNIYTQPRLSPGAKYAYGYSDTDSTWWTYHIETAKFSLLDRKGLPLFYDELNDIPGHPNSYGAAGWTQGDGEFILYDRFDLWKWTPTKNNIPVALTTGRNTNTIYRYIHTDREQDYLSATKPWLIHVTDDMTKSSGYAWYTPLIAKLEKSELSPYLYSRQVLKSRDVDTYVFRKENFQVFPDLHITSDKFATEHQISMANPQQNEYKWGTIQLYEWMDWDSVMRKGLLVLPHGYDTLRSYPLIVNFYERYTDALHNHPTIEPHRSTINYAFYASRGYAIFNPDINYEIGLPGESAYKAVMSGVQALIKDRIADHENLALQGHSWGGYQIAYIVTRTEAFKCAAAGASVVNMTSAYGGIRWGTGMSRMFQYERAQSRLGKTLWEDPQRYIANSPLFKINKINTPLLIMHNDEDAAVPFEQGIEFYLALRRLGKTAWLLNYRGEPHWPVKWENKKDFQLRMAQFFDHYLKGAPMPRWMEKGITAMERGIEAGY